MAERDSRWDHAECRQWRNWKEAPSEETATANHWASDRVFDEKIPKRSTTDGKCAGKCLDNAFEVTYAPRSYISFAQAK